MAKINSQNHAISIIEDLSRRNFKPVYFLFGEETYYIDLITEYAIKNILKEEEKAFNQTILYGRDVDARAIANAAKRYPMMSDYQLIVLKEAQDVSDFKELVHYFTNPLSATILIINYKYKKPDGRLQVFREIKKHGIWFESSRFYPDKIPQWISSYLNKKKYDIESKASALLGEFLGTDLSKLAHELDKLLITLPAGEKTITADHVEKNIGISKDYNNFELQNALSGRDVLKANRIINYFASNQKNIHISQTISSLHYFFSRLLHYHVLKDKSPSNVATQLSIHPYFVSEYQQAARIYSVNKVVRIFSVLREYDLKSKGYGNSSADAGDLLKELIYKIMH